jgi:AcrR family transcriptional regulator
MALKLENARESLMKCGKAFLLHNRDGKAGKFNIRELTVQCGMALGTFYHYFDSKDDLVRQNMLEDWLEIMEEVDSIVKSDDSFYGKLKFIYIQICDFEQTYRCSALNQLGQTAENRKFKTECMKNLQNKVSVFLTAEMERNRLQLSAKIDAAAYLLVRLIGAAARNPALSFDDLWNCMNFREISGRSSA